MRAVRATGVNPTIPSNNPKSESKPEPDPKIQILAPSHVDVAGILFHVGNVNRLPPYGKTVPHNRTASNIEELDCACRGRYPKGPPVRPRTGALSRTGPVAPRAGGRGAGLRGGLVPRGLQARSAIAEGPKVLGVDDVGLVRKDLLGQHPVDFGIVVGGRVG
jgi:hypothetical protein